MSFVQQIVGDARNHGVEIRPVCINRSRWTVAGNEPGNRFPANRLPMLTVVMLSD
jgi:error-prone DNA polymerase